MVHKCRTPEPDDGTIAIATVPPSMDPKLAVSSSKRKLCKSLLIADDQQHPADTVFPSSNTKLLKFETNRGSTTPATNDSPFPVLSTAVAQVALPTTTCLDPQKPPRKRSRNKSSNYRGVSRCSKDGRWQARIRIGRSVKYLGRYRTEREAAMIYDASARRFHGPKATLNFSSPPPDTSDADAIVASMLKLEDQQMKLGGPPASIMQLESQSMMKLERQPMKLGTAQHASMMKLQSQQEGISSELSHAARGLMLLSGSFMAKAC